MLDKDLADYFCTDLPAVSSSSRRSQILTPSQINTLRDTLEGRLMTACFGAGVDSTAMLVALRAAGLRPTWVMFADTGGEKPETLSHIPQMNAVLKRWGWPQVLEVRHRTIGSTPYRDLEGNCVANETLPSLAFGMKSCSIKWKQKPQDQALMGAKSGPNARPPDPIWAAAAARGERVVKLIGYDSGKADTLEQASRLRRTLRLYLSPSAYRLGAGGLRASDHRGTWARHGSGQVRLLSLPSQQAMGALVARRHAPKPFRACIAHGACCADRPPQPFQRGRVRRHLGESSAKRRPIPELEYHRRPRAKFRLEPMGACKQRGG